MVDIFAFFFMLRSIVPSEYFFPLKINDIHYAYFRQDLQRYDVEDVQLTKSQAGNMYL